MKREQRRVWRRQVGVALSTLILRLSVQPRNSFHPSYIQIWHAEHCAVWKYVSVWQQESAMLSPQPKPDLAICPGAGREHWAISMSQSTLFLIPSGNTNIQSHESHGNALKPEFTLAAQPPRSCTLNWHSVFSAAVAESGNLSTAIHQQTAKICVKLSLPCF